MARILSNLLRDRQGRRANSVFLASATVVFVVVVFLLFRGHSSGPQEVVAGSDAGGASPVTETGREAPRLAVVETNRPAGTPVTPAPPAAATAPVQEPPVTLAPAAPPNAEVETILAEAKTLIESQPRKVIAARNKLNEAMSLPMNPDQLRTVKEQLAALSQEWLFGPAAFAGDPLCDNYLVKPGDSLQVIGRRHKIPYEILMQINNIRRPQSLQAGKTIKVINGPFHAKICRSTFTLDLYLQDTYVRSFKVGLGRPGYETPTGGWRVQDGGKLISPTWTDPDSGRTYKASDSDYPLGSRWIALDGVEGEAKGRTGFAIHGTKDPDQIGTAGSRGCIRMYNGDAVLVYNLLFPLYSKVEIVN
jgi:LysM repeat protein